MNDPWGSVESMLRWQIDLLKARIDKTRAGIIASKEVYPLPKPKAGNLPHGQPENWAFGKYSPTQVNLSHTLQAIDSVSMTIAKCEESLQAGDLPKAVYWTIQATQGLHGATALWNSGSAVTMWRYVEQYRKNKARVAKFPRGKVSDDGPAISEVIGNLALSKEHEAESAKELWRHFYSELDRLGLNPVEEDDPHDLRKSKYIYQTGNGSRQITFSHFSDIVSEYRSGKKSG